MEKLKIRNYNISPLTRLSSYTVKFQTRLNASPPPPPPIRTFHLTFDDECQIVVLRRVPAPLAHALDDCRADLFCRKVRRFGQNSLQPALSELFVFRVKGFGHAVRVSDEHIAALQLDHFLLVDAIAEHADDGAAALSTWSLRTPLADSGSDEAEFQEGCRAPARFPDRLPQHLRTATTRAAQPRRAVRLRREREKADCDRR